MRILITGSGGLVGYEASIFYLEKGHEVVGIDNDMRAQFYGPLASVKANIADLSANASYTHYHDDIRDAGAIDKIFSQWAYDLIIHAAAQPSHNYAAEIPLVDFDINARATLNLLELTRKKQSHAVFVYISTNKVYGEHPNQLRIENGLKRFEFSDEAVRRIGISEQMSLDRTTHSLMGASKLAADVYVQEYGHYHNLKTACFRCGCITGSRQSGVSQHGFLNYIAKQAVNSEAYTIFGFEGKQVRDHIHAYDLVTAIDAFYQKPGSGQVFNIGGGYENSLSILETIDILKSKGYNLDYELSDSARIGDHMCYYSDNSKFQRQHPDWQITRKVESIIDEIIKSCDG